MSDDTDKIRCRSWAKALKRWGDDWSRHYCGLPRGHKGKHICRGAYGNRCMYLAEWEQRK